MKKKFKLLFSIATLCFSIAILSFGVYAASTVTYTASGNVSYDVSSVFCKIESKVYYCSGTNSGISDEGSLYFMLMSLNGWQEVSGGSNLTYDTGLDPTADDHEGGTLPEIEFENSSLYRITSTITVYKQEKSIKITPSIAANQENGATNTLLTAFDSANSGAIDEPITVNASAAQQTVTINFYVALKDVTLSASGSYTITINVEQA